MSEFPVIKDRMGHSAVGSCQQTKRFICFDFSVLLSHGVEWCFHCADKWDSVENTDLRKKKETVTVRAWKFLRAHAVSYSCFWVCCCCYPWLIQKEIPRFPHRDTLTLTVTCSSVRAQQLKTVTACPLCSITPSRPSCLLPQCRLGRNYRDSISSVVNSWLQPISHKRLL